MSTSSISSKAGAAYKPRLYVKSLPLGMYKIRLHKKDRKHIQKLQDDITDFDPTIDVLTLKLKFGGTGWLLVKEQLFNAIEPFYDVRRVKSRVKVR